MQESELWLFQMVLETDKGRPSNFSVLSRSINPHRHIINNRTAHRWLQAHCVHNSEISVWQNRDGSSTNNCFSWRGDYFRDYKPDFQRYPVQYSRSRINICYFPCVHQRCSPHDSNLPTASPAAVPQENSLGAAQFPCRATDPAVKRNTSLSRCWIISSSPQMFLYTTWKWECPGQHGYLLI